MHARLRHPDSDRVTLSLSLPMSTRDLLPLLRDETDAAANHYAPPLRLAGPRPPRRASAPVRPLREVSSATDWRINRHVHQGERFFDVQAFMTSLQRDGYEVRCYPINDEWSVIETRPRQSEVA